AVLIALCRLYVGVHYPSDVLAGMLTGLTCGFLAMAIMRRFS
ncbi:MAG: phosphatase PAP2 family protein, partial [Clostridiales bacterium]|nr:phosphatase PAP2 family protein [Clostridiales bacterium]